MGFVGFLRVSLWVEEREGLALRCCRGDGSAGEEAPGGSGVLMEAGNLTGRGGSQGGGGGEGGRGGSRVLREAGNWRDRGGSQGRGTGRGYTRSMRCRKGSAGVRADSGEKAL